MIMHKNIRAAVQNIKDGPRVLKQENLGSKTEKDLSVRIYTLREGISMKL
jgi:hypothetical protein